MSQTELGHKLDMPQTTVSRWERGTVDLTLEQALEIEVILGLPHGTLAKAGGYIEPSKDDTPRTVEQLMRTDPNLDPDIRQDAIQAYRSYVALSQRLRREESVTTTRPSSRRRTRSA